MSSYVSITAAAPITPVESAMASTFLANRPCPTARRIVAANTAPSASLTNNRDRNTDNVV